MKLHIVQELVFNVKNEKYITYFVNLNSCYPCVGININFKNIYIRYENINETVFKCSF